MTQIGQ